MYLIVILGKDSNTANVEYITAVDVVVVDKSNIMNNPVHASSKNTISLPAVINHKALAET